MQELCQTLLAWALHAGGRACALRDWKRARVLVPRSGALHTCALYHLGHAHPCTVPRGTLPQVVARQRDAPDRASFCTLVHGPNGTLRTCSGLVNPLCRNDLRARRPGGTRPALPLRRQRPDRPARSPHRYGGSDSGGARDGLRVPRMSHKGRRCLASQGWSRDTLLDASLASQVSADAPEGLDPQRGIWSPAYCAPIGNARHLVGIGHRDKAPVRNPRAPSGQAHWTHGRHSHRPSGTREQASSLAHPSVSRTRVQAGIWRVAQGLPDMVAYR